MRPVSYRRFQQITRFPFLFGGTFIEASSVRSKVTLAVRFPFLFGGTFIEAFGVEAVVGVLSVFPFLFGGTFIEARSK